MTSPDAAPDARIKAEALREAADALGHWMDKGLVDDPERWLRERADRIETQP